MVNTEKSELEILLEKYMEEENRYQFEKFSPEDAKEPGEMLYEESKS